MTFKEFRTNAKGWSVDDLTSAFTWGYERPNRTAGEESMPDRQAFARKCMAELDWTGTGGAGPSPTPRKGTALPVKTKTPSKTYKVKAGDNLTKIAKAKKTTVAKLVKLNHIKNPNKIYIGQVIKY
jgi:hypothetical protein